MNLLGKIKYVLNIPRIYSNFWLGIFSMLGLLRRDKTYCYRLRNGLKFYATGSKWDFFILNEIFIIKEYDVKLQAEPRTIVDIGAHIGTASLFFAKKYPDAEIYSIEPFQKNFNFLNKNVRENNFSGRIKTCRFALGKDKKKAKLFLNKDNDGCHSILEDYNVNGETVEVEVKPFEIFLSENAIERVDLLKMDCEGAELQIVKSINDFSKIKNIVMEVRGAYIAEIKDFLKQKGFRVRQIEDRPLIFASKSN